MNSAASPDFKHTVDLAIRHVGRFGLWAITLGGLAFLYLPIAILVVYSFNASRMNAVWRGFTLDWYRSLFAGVTESGVDVTNAQIWDALWNSLWVGGISTVVATILGTLVALALERFRFKGRNALEALLFLPIIIPDITMGISLLVLFSLLFQLLQTVLGVRLVLDLNTVMIGHITFNISYVAVTVRSRIAELDPALEEAAMDLGADELRTFWRVTLPLIFPGILSGALLAFTLSLDDFVITFFTAGVGSTTLPVFVYGMIKLAVTPAINAISTLMLLASLLIVLLSLALQRRST
ncbi:ABC transporter permease [Spirulina major CS-329]|uniref:ABC transporter permease n=1 Tax=Spirulina TaxID=1154 RepID=UPI00232E6A05|nr:MULTISPECIES: ABC transporter permease [Spirulina]MDB9495708.1 ABC transporter permease [Spirulina subsalsa CS-330]MDB9504349.1 ABC transporter permease [Spirulina major CS-329]